MEESRKEYITEFGSYEELPFSNSINRALFQLHTHAELVDDGSEIVYTEKDVLYLMQLLETDLIRFAEELLGREIKDSEFQEYKNKNK